MSKPTPLLDAHVRRQALTYPTLYRAGDWETSRILVLSKMFLTIGNGYEWKDGMLLYGDTPDPIDTPDLPPDFFDKLIWELRVDPLKLEEVEQALQGTYYWVQPRSKHCDVRRVYFEADEDEASRLMKLYHVPLQPDYPGMFKPRAATAIRTIDPWVTIPWQPTFSPISTCSAIVEMVEGKTYEGETLDPHPEWIAGAVDLARFALASYLDQERSEYEKQYHYFCSGKDASKELKQKYWEDRVAKQLRWLRAFLDKFDEEC